MPSPVSDVLDRFKKEKVGLSVESQYDPTKIKRAETVLKDILSEHGHQFATIKTEVKTIPPASVQVNFNIKEGPTVKVGQIKFTGNQHMSSAAAAPLDEEPEAHRHSVFDHLRESLCADLRRLQAGGRYRAGASGLPRQGLLQRRHRGAQDADSRPGRAELVHLPAQQGQAHRHSDAHRRGRALPAGHASPSPATRRCSNEKALRATFAVKDGDWFNATLIGKGLENLKKAYGQLGYINFGAIPKPVFDEEKKTVSLSIDIDEGKPFYVSRIEFQGNTITRDKVIRRELMLEEGQVYNSQLWEYSLLRLNQLEYFEPLKVDQDSEAHQDAEAGTVDLLLKVKEKGKNSIGLNGGVSGLSGAFLGVNYQTNNFLGLGETLSLQGNLGSVSRQFTVRLLPALCPQPPAQRGLPDLQHQAGLQLGQELPGQPPGSRPT